MKSQESIDRSLRLELAKPISETWETVGPLMRTLAKATPKLLNAAHDARVAIEVAGRESVKAKIAPDAKAASADGLAYQAVLRAVDRLRAWGEKKKHPFAGLEVPGGMASAIARTASQAYARRDQGRQRFASERILVRAAETSLLADAQGITVAVKLRPPGAVRFAVRHSWGAHREILDKIVSGALPHGDCKIQFDDRRNKWYALLAYEMQAPEAPPVDASRVLAVHRGVRNALYLLASSGERALALPGGKFSAQRRALQARMRDMRRVSAEERGPGANGHGRARRYESHDALEGKLARVTHTFCQQAAAFVGKTAQRLGCGVVVIEEYGGIEPSSDPCLRRVLDRFPFHDLKEAIINRLAKDGLTFSETPSEYISSTCPRCNEADTRAHNTRTGIFHCRVCNFERPADWVASYWMLKHSGADMGIWEARLQDERELTKVVNSVRSGSGFIEEERQ